VEASGSYSWLVDEMERAGHHPRLCNPHEAKRRMGLTNKTDKLDAKGLAILLRNGTLPEVWIPPSELRDQRELLRLRIFLVRLRTRVKNRIHGTLSPLIRPVVNDTGACPRSRPSQQISATRTSF
jgi:transposase